MAANAELVLKPSHADMVRILVVDDDELFRESLQQNLIDSGFDSWAFGDGPAVLAFLEDGNRADLILLDWRMPGMSGIELLRKLRSDGHDVPVIFLTALSDQMYEEAALIGGAVDFVEKSRSYTILKRRIELIMNGPKSNPAEGAILQDNEGQIIAGPLILHPQIGRADWDGHRLSLTLTEFRIVNLLVNHSGRDVRYREIYDLVRGEGFIAGMGEQGYRANVRAFIKRIRQKFREVDNGFDRIENYPGFGYRWRIDP
ncbi:MAG: DNA-binding response regulator [Rhodospirillaceae bacterium]|nr:DNA-binding response regulator [Rhodospirillaceae bacterium]|tara:strand:- start:29273 stop:30046 length:774 start_codon:yes stop_codon:yes gene_type:complete